MAHSAKFDKVKKYYNSRLWTLNQVKEAVTHDWITADEFEEITDQKYEA